MTKKPFFRQANVRGGIALLGVGFVLFPMVATILQIVFGDAVARVWVSGTTIGATTIAGQILPSITTGTFVGLIGALWLLWPKMIEAYHEWRNPGGSK